MVYCIALLLSNSKSVIILMINQRQDALQTEAMLLKEYVGGTTRCEIADIEKDKALLLLF